MSVKSRHDRGRDVAISASISRSDTFIISGTRFACWDALTEERRMTRTTTMTRLALVAVLSLTMIGAWGCRRRPPVTASGALSARYERTLIRTAARDTGCPAGQLTPMQVHVGPQVWSVTGCASPVEYWLQCSRRNRCSWRRVPLLNESAAATLQCPPQAIQQQPSPQPNVRFAAGCGRQQPFTVACNGAGCGW
ncbi:MAG TPA: hypothetical protein DEF51_17670, partial [Myxococcales bacterium]|nr:hypothetical protein [Myxococcales bacterium]